MKAIFKNKLLVLLSALVMLFCGIIGGFSMKSATQEANAEGAVPTLTIESNNVAYADSIYILYAVSNDGFDRNQDEIKMLFWEDVQEEYVVGTEKYAVTNSGTAKVKGKSCLIFYSDGLAAKEMTEDIYARAYAEVDGVAYYSDVMKFSILEYVYSMMEKGGLTTNQRNLFENMLNYGAAAQYQFNHNVDRIANGDYYSITIINGKLPDGFAHGRYKNKESIKVKADKAPEGMKFSHWVDEKGIIVSYDEHIEIELKGNKTYEAVYKDISSVATQLVLTAEVPYDGDTNDIELPTAVSIDVGGETVTLEVTWNTESFKTNTVGTQTLYATLVDQTAYDKYDIEVGGIMMNVKTLPYTYAIDQTTGEYILTGYYGTDTEITLPTSYRNTFITTIASKAFNKALTLTNVVIPNTYTKIEQTAFFLCDNIESITVPFVGETATSNNSWFGWIFGASNYETQYGLLPLAMKEVTIADGATIVPRYAFYKCSQIEKFNLPRNITALKGQAFAYCTAITEFTIPDSLKEFSYAFDGCTNLKKIEVSNIDILFSLDSNWSGPHASPFAMGADLYCKGNLVTELNIPVGTTHLNYMWQNCTSIEKITIPNTVISSEQNAFRGMKNLKTVVFEEGFTMETLEGETFSQCSSLTSIEIPDSITKIDWSAFYDCSSLETIVIPDSVTSIGNYAFYGCSSLTSVVIPDSVTSIGDSAFYECSSLTTIKLPNGITSIASWAFSYCRSLTSIEIPELIYDIQEYAFYGCNNLLQITILSKRLTSIENEAFSECRQLFEIYNLSNLEFTIGSDDFGGIAKYAKVIHTSLDETACVNVDSEGFVTYSDGDENILFDYVGNGGDITLPAKINGKNYDLKDAFDGNKKITSVVIPDGVMSIGYGAFASCSNMIGVIIGDDVTIIDEYAFSGCTSLTSVVIGDNVTSIGNWAFYNCKNLTSITFTGTVAQWGEITKGYDWKYNVPATKVVCKDGEVAL